MTNKDEDKTKSKSSVKKLERTFHKTCITAQPSFVHRLGFTLYMAHIIHPCMNMSFGSNRFINRQNRAG